MSSGEPQPRYYHAAFGVGLKHYLWGGYDDSAIQTTQIETFDIFSARWLEPSALQGSPPDNLVRMAVTTDGELGYTFGGWKCTTANILVNTVYELNLETLQCREIPVASSYSPPRISDSAIVYFDEKLVAYGGLTDRARTDDLHVFDLRKSECGI